MGVHPRVGLAGRLHVALVDPDQGLQIVLPASRELRPDLPPHFPDAPLCGGFRAQARVGEAWRDGCFTCVLVNSVDAVATAQVTDRRLVVEDGRIAEAGFDRPDAARIAGILDVLEGRWQPPLTPVLPPAPLAPTPIRRRRMKV